MRIDYQNLDDGPVRCRWSHGRAWVRRPWTGDDRRVELEVEWAAPPAVASWGVTLGTGDSGRNLLVYATLPFVASVYVTLSNVFRLYRFGTDFDRGHDRDVSLSFCEWTLCWTVWVGRMASWSRAYPWCRWWRQGSVDLRDVVLGRPRCDVATLREGIPVIVPMPEGSYAGTATVERRTWTRPRWFAHSRVSTTIDAEKGIPYAGKGENSWDCGDDGLWGWSVEGDDVEGCVGHGVAVVLRNRRRYGMPSPASIEKALA